MGTNWAGLLLAGVGFVLIPVPFLFFKYGKRIRTHSKYAFEL
jgi:DHA1 family multidrug resistance protein-like MFS transporter